MKCASCKTDLILCPTCNGNGRWFTVVDPEGVEFSACVTCNGTGTLRTSVTSMKAVMKELTAASKRFDAQGLLPQSQTKPTRKRKKKKA